MATGLVFVTVGTTKFDKLIANITSSPVLSALLKKGYGRLTLQIGNGEIEPPDGLSAGVLVEHFRFTDTLDENIKRADLVISHAGAGSCLEVLRAAKPLVVVVNEDLMDNHQNELADALSARLHAYSCTTTTLKETIEEMDVNLLQPYPSPDRLAFINFLNNIMEIKS